MKESVQAEFGGRTLTIETGHLAKQAGGSVVVKYGDTVVLVTATAATEPKEGIDFFPLTVDYVEKTFAAGKIPGGFFKREGRPSERAVLTSRFIDRPIRPLFPEGFRNETQLIATVLSVDNENEPDVLAMIGASAALTISPVPFLGPIAGVCVGRVDGKFIVNPTPTQMDQSDIDIIMAASKEAVVMVEGGAAEVSEEDMLAAIQFGHQSILPILKIQEDLAKKVGKPKWEVKAPEVSNEIPKKVHSLVNAKLQQAMSTREKQKRSDAVKALKNEAIAALLNAENPTAAPTEDPNYGAVIAAFELEQYNVLRQMILKQKKRVDGRGTKDIRPISCEVGLLPRAHGSALFTRGETQALVVTTLGSSDDQQRIDSLSGEYFKNFMLHYNFPPFSTGEVKFLRSPGRREVGHGALAERALARVLPAEDKFPYTVRIVSEILESNGSSSMASVCGGSLSLMDAGVPVTAPVAGIAMGLIKEGDDYAILSDILGDEDHLGDMDFKVAGTVKGVTALQMDIKITGLSAKIMEEALTQAHEGRLHILKEMAKVMEKPRAEIAPHAPKITQLTINPDKIGALIGPGGKMIRSIVEETGAKIDVEDDGTVRVFAIDQVSGEAALRRIRAVTAVPEIGKYYRGTVVKLMDFGAFVEILPGCDGLVHISQLDHKRVNQVSDVLKEGDELVVKVLEIEAGSGKIRLSRKEALDYNGEVLGGE